MPWFKVDDKLHDHRKARQAGVKAMGVWVLAGTWAADNLTDGFVPAHVLSRWGTKADAKRLVEAGLWQEGSCYSEVGWWFHEWHEHQPTREQVEDRRKKRADAGRLGGLKSAESRASEQAKSKQSAPPLASGVVEAKPKQTSTPTRPDPTVSNSDELLTPTAPADAVAEREPDTSFSKFWDAYDKKIGRGAAEKAWHKAVKKSDASTIVAAAEQHADWHRRNQTEDRFVPHASTWLNEERWRDERSPPERRQRTGTDDIDWEAAMARARSRDAQGGHQ